MTRALTAILCSLLLVSAGACAESGDDEVATKLAVGDPAPNFSLKGSDGKIHRLSDFKGKQAVVIAWFPKAFTGG